ncbi:MAG: Hsp20/alpha crystallin family protein [Planctomycetes bacterium]|nr:Hsp20/alpha crystallin family protein [Planctomycetota bacterium]
MNTKLTRFDPFTGLTRWGEDLDQFFNDFWRTGASAEASLLSPAIDVAENEGALTVSAELPGLERKDIDLTVKDGVLMLRGEKRMEEESRDRKYHRIERRYGSFYRALALPDTVDADRVDAAFRNGVLTVTLPKRPESKPRNISIKE